MDQGLSRPRRLRAAPAVGVFLLFLAITVGLLVDVWRSPLDHIDGTADALQSIWFMSWPPYALAHAHSPFVTTYMNYPAGINLLWNTSAEAPALLLWPVTAIRNAVLSYNVIMTASVALAGAFAFVAIRRYVPRTLPAAAGAAVYAFSPYVMAHLTGHLHSVASAVTAPLALLLLDELLIRQRINARMIGALLALLGVMPYFTHEENFVSELILGVLLGIVLAALFRSRVRERWPYVRRALLVAVPLTAVLLAYPVYVQLLGPDRVLGAVHDSGTYSTDLLNLVLPDFLQWLAPEWAQSAGAHFTGNPSEWNGYIGVPLLAITLFTIVRWWRVPLVRVAGIMAALATLLSLGPHLHVGGRVTPVPLPGWVAARIPLIRDILPARLMVYAYLAVALILAFALGRIAVTRAGAALAWAIAVVALIPLVPAFPLRSLPVSQPAFFTTSAVTVIPQGAVALSIPWPGVATTDAISWDAAARMRFRLIGGYFLGRPSPQQESLRAFADALSGTAPIAPLTDQARAQLLSLLHDNNVGVVFLEAVPQEAASRVMLSDLLGSQPRDIGGIDMWLLPTTPPRG